MNGHPPGPDPRSAAPLNPTQRATFDHLLVVGGERPYAREGLAGELTATIEHGTSAALRRWTESTLWLSKGALFSVLRCEGAFVASRAQDQVQTAMHPTTAVGQIAHRAIQMVHTHPGTPTEEVVRNAVEGCKLDEAFKDFWEQASAATQSDVLVQATSRTMGLIDSWPALHPSWAPRFEEPLQAKIGKLTLSGRVDLLLGRPRADLRQTMVISDWKSGSIKDEHDDEASFYALLATLRFGVPPFRSVIYSLASGTWTDPDVTEDKLRASAALVVESVNAMVDTMTGHRPPELTPSAACNWCPLKATCPEGPVLRKPTAPTLVALPTPAAPAGSTPAGSPLSAEDEEELPEDPGAGPELEEVGQGAAEVADEGHPRSEPGDGEQASVWDITPAS